MQLQQNRTFIVFIMGCLLATLALFGLNADLHAEEIPEDIARSMAQYKSEYGDEYIIGVGDTLNISVWRNDDLSITVPVRPDGKVSGPLIGDFQAAGLSPMQLSSLVKIKLTKFVRDPQVSVIVTGLSSHEFISRVRLVGAVQTPLTVPHRKGMTVLDLLLSAGGVNEFASANKARLYRSNESGEVEVIRLKLKDLVQKGKLEYNYDIEPGDVITVPERLF